MLRVRRKPPLKEILADKLREPNTVFLLGGGASFCAGLPGTFQLTQLLLSNLRTRSRSTVEDIIRLLTEAGIKDPTIEEILSELHHRLDSAALAAHNKEQCNETFEEVCECIRNALRADHPTEYHKGFVLRVVSRRDAEPVKKTPPVRIFTTNYDLLIELACEESQIVVINGFEGIFRRRWNPTSFDYDIGKATTHVLTPRFEPSARHIRLYKLHGSLSWFEEKGQFYEEKPNSESNKPPLIIYPSRRKYTESIRLPFDWLFRRFGDAISEANMLVSIGYRFGDEHLNQYIFAGLEDGLSLLALSKGPIGALSSRSSHPRVNLINQETTVIDGNDQGEAIDLWSFETFAQWLPALKEK